MSDQHQNPSSGTYDGSPSPSSGRSGSDARDTGALVSMGLEPCPLVETVLGLLPGVLVYVDADRQCHKLMVRQDPPSEPTSLAEAIGEDMARISRPCMEEAMRGRQRRCEASYSGDDQEPRYVQIDAVPWPEPGRRAGCLLLVQDVTDRSRARERVGFQGQLLDNVRESVVATDLDGRVTYWGKGAQNLYGYEPKEVLGRVITFIVDPDQKVEEESRLRQVLARGLWSGRYRQRRKDGSVFWSDTVISLVCDEQGRPTGFIGIDRDVTSQVRAQQQLVRYQQRLREMARELSRAEDRQRRQLASALHDGVGQNLFGVKAHLESVLQQQHGCSQADHIRDILKVVEDTMSDIRSLTVDICPPILYERGLDAALRYLCETFQERHGIDCVLEGSGGGALAEDLRGLLYQAVRELLNNVAKHARADSARIALHRQKGLVRIRVEDDGVGMSAQEAQEDRPTGFGLFHIREMLQAASGHLRIDSRPGEGTSVELTLPVAGDSD